MPKLARVVISADPPTYVSGIAPDAIGTTTNPNGAEHFDLSSERLTMAVNYLRAHRTPYRLEYLCDRCAQILQLGRACSCLEL